MQSLKIRLLFIFSTILYLFSSTVIPTFANISYTYDADGNMASDNKYCYSYNEENQLIQVKDCGTNQIIAQYVYDYQGNRLIKKNYVNGTLNNTVYSPEDEYETRKIASNGAIENTSYYFVNNQQLAKKNPDGSKTFVHNDDLGSSSVLTNQSGNSVETTTYDPWGEVKTGGTKDKFQYTGQEKDSETGLNYYNSRYYNSHIRRFTQPDDILPNKYDPQQLNRYSYVTNNPLTFTDPTGHAASDDKGGATGAIPMFNPSADAFDRGDYWGTAWNASDYVPEIGQDKLIFIGAIKLAPDLGRPAARIIEKGVTYYNNMSTFRKYEGKAGEGMNWGHFVEQNKTNIQQFGKQAIHNTENVIRMPAEVNKEMNRIYSSKREGTNMTIREFINKKPYIEQFKFAVKTYKDLIKQYFKKK